MAWAAFGQTVGHLLTSLCVTPANHHLGARIDKNGGDSLAHSLIAPGNDSDSVRVDQA